MGKKYENKSEPASLVDIVQIDLSNVGMLERVAEDVFDYEVVAHFLEPYLKRKGIASAPMRALTDWGCTKGCDEFWLATEIDNDEAIAFYKTLNLLKTDVVMFANFVDD